MTLHKIPSFKEPVDEDDQHEDDPSEQPGTSAAVPNAEQAKESEALLTYDNETLEAASNSDINTEIQKEEELLKTFTPNLNTLNDYDKKASTSILQPRVILK